jgi:hypothetical protein
MNPKIMIPIIYKAGETPARWWSGRGSGINLWTLNPEPGTLNPESWTRNPEPWPLNPEPPTLDLKPLIINHPLLIRNPEPLTVNPSLKPYTKISLP